MPRLGVPSTTDSAPRGDATAVANRPPAAVDKSPAQRSTWRHFQPLIESRERDERKALERLRTSIQPASEGAAPWFGRCISSPGQLFPINNRYPLEVIDFSNFSPDCAAPRKGLQRPRRQVGQDARKHHLGLCFSVTAL